MAGRITVDPQIHFGKPCVAGTRIPVENVLELLRAGHSHNEIRRDFYPDVTDDDIQACIRYSEEADRRI